MFNPAPGEGTRRTPIGVRGTFTALGLGLMLKCGTPQVGENSVQIELIGQAVEGAIRQESVIGLAVENPCAAIDTAQLLYRQYFGA